MRRGSTPLVTLSSDDVTFSDYAEVVVTFRQGNNIVNKVSDDMTVSSNTLEFRLTQEDTLALAVSKQKVLIQIKLKDNDSCVFPSDLGSFSMEKVLNEEVI